ncbi:hypothetical protein BKA93DRAFT_741529 [Sparassis latifolia]
MCSITLVVYARPQPQCTTIQPTYFGRLSARHLNPSEFQRYWCQGVPVIVTDVNSCFQGNWGPAYFIEQYGGRKVTVQDCETELTKSTTVADFFMAYGRPETRASILKLKDWPPQTNFNAEFPELFKAFTDAVPIPDMARLDGVMNLAAHFPHNGIAPDLGPKMYNAYGSPQDSHHHGSTKLHIDITDAVNIMLWAMDGISGRPGHAVWHLFKAESAPLIRKFLLDAGISGVGDPIHSQNVYLTPEMLDSLAAKYDVLPYVIYQHPGEAVFIPAGCPHQVSNEMDAIKIACDFLSVEHLLQTQDLIAQFRYQRIRSTSGDDILQFYTTLWYAWSSLFSNCSGCPIISEEDDISHPSLTSDEHEVAVLTLLPLAPQQQA